MIYLIDENINRQNELGWNESRFREYSDILFLINDVNSLLKNITDIKNNPSFVLIHESFKDLTAFSNKVFIENFIKEITEIAKDKKIYLVFFSGGKNERSIVDNVISLPVNIFYQNLSVFLDRYNQKLVDIKYLIYGENIQIEENLINLLNTKNSDIDETIEFENSSKSLIVKSFDFEIEDPFKETTSEIIYEDIITDVFLNEFCINHLNLVEYDNIFIPISFGSVLSDFNGLRLATHIRCTNTKNQLKPIFIFSYTELESIFDTEYFNILKTKNVFFIKHKKSAFREALELNIKPLLNDTLSKEIRKLKLDIPLNHQDQHSIANLWAIYRWSQTINAKDENIEKIIELQNSSLYFKYLKTINPIKLIDKFNTEQLKIKYEGSPKILYIDDEAEKGWYEIFCEILFEKNKFDFTYLDDEFNEKTQDEIIDLSIKKVIDENIDLVILDFRLHKEDFENKNIKEITGYQILKKIKQYNKGIQVIVFSATNKIWNLQALQDAGADGFILKESPENSIDSEFTKQSVENLIKTIDKCLNSIFLKDFYTKLEILKGYLIPRKKYKKSNNPLPKEFVDETLKWYELSLSFLNIGINEEQLISTFLIYFTIIENISNRVIEVENPINEGDFYKFQFRKNLQRLNNYIEDNQKPGFYRKTNSKYKSSKRNLRWDIKIYNTIDFISDNKLSIESINVLVKKRNDIIHSNSTFGNVIEIKKDNILLLNKIIFEGLMNVI
jgi:CheY-like chemotaxis protein